MKLHFGKKLFDFIILVILVYIFFYCSTSLDQQDLKVFLFKIIFPRSKETIIISMFVSIIILFISTFIACISIYFQKYPISILALIISMYPVVFIIEFLNKFINEQYIEIISLIFSGFLIYYFSEQLHYDLSKELSNTYVEAYKFKNHMLINTLKEKIILQNLIQFPVCFIQVATYTLFTDKKLYLKVNGKGIMSWVYTAVTQDQYSDKITYIILMIIVIFLLLIKLYNMTILRFFEKKILG